MNLRLEHRLAIKMPPSASRCRRTDSATGLRVPSGVVSTAGDSKVTSSMSAARLRRKIHDLTFLTLSAKARR
eukprot:299538-Amphidinium_carterae.1